MLKMRLQRIGRKNSPSYRLIVTDSRNAVSRGREVAVIGTYEPRLKRVQIESDQVKHWLSKGVQPSDTVYNLLISQKLIEGKKRNVLPRKSPVIDEAKLKAEAEAKAAKEAEAKASKEAEAKAVKEAEEAKAAAQVEEAAPEVEAAAEEQKSE